VTTVSQLNVRLEVKCKYCYCGKAMGIKHYECASVSLPYIARMQITSFLCEIILSLMACLAVPWLSTLSYKWHDFWGKKIVECKSVFWFHLQPLVWNISDSKKNSVRHYLKVHRLHVKYPLFLSDFNQIFERFKKKKQHISNFMKICPMGAELFHLDRWPHMMKLTVTFQNSVNVPKQTWLFGTKIHLAL